MEADLINHHDKAEAIDLTAGHDFLTPLVSTVTLQPHTSAASLINWHPIHNRMASRLWPVTVICTSTNCIALLAGIVSGENFGIDNPLPVILLPTPTASPIDAVV